MLHAIEEVDSNEDHSQKASAPHELLSSGGSLSDPKSDGMLRSAGGNSEGDDAEPRNGKQGGRDDGAARASVQELLALVESERNKMSKAVLSSADGLASAVTAARKRLAANIAAVEEQLREEKRTLEQARGEQPLTATTSSVGELQMLLHARDAELETLRRNNRMLEEERDSLRSEVAAVKKELEESKHRSSAAVESAAALQAEVDVLRGKVTGREAFPVPPPIPELIPPPTSYNNLKGPTTDSDRAFTLADAQHTPGELQGGGLSDRAQTAENSKPEQRGPVMESILRRKKTDHGRFEDPWKLRMQASLGFDGLLRAVVVQDAHTKGVNYDKWESVYDVKNEWHLAPDRRVAGSKAKFDPMRFDLVHKQTGEVASFKTDAVEETDKWVMALMVLKEGREPPRTGVGVQKELDMNQRGKSPLKLGYPLTPA